MSGTGAARPSCSCLAGAVAAALALCPTADARSATRRRDAPGSGTPRPWSSTCGATGSRRRVKRIKHWWTCEAQPSLLQPQPALPIAPAPATPPAKSQTPEVGHLGVKAVEYSYTLSRPEVSAGEVIVELNNQGEDPHNLVLEHEGTEDPTLEIPSTPSVSQASASFTLSPGTYRLYCSLYKHEAKGMQATLVVSGS